MFKLLKSFFISEAIREASITLPHADQKNICAFFGKNSLPLTVQQIKAEESPAVFAFECMYEKPTINKNHALMKSINEKVGIKPRHALFSIYSDAGEISFSVGAEYRLSDINIYSNPKKWKNAVISIPDTSYFDARFSTHPLSDEDASIDAYSYNEQEEYSDDLYFIYDDKKRTLQITIGKHTIFEWAKLSGQLYVARDKAHHLAGFILCDVAL